MNTEMEADRVCSVCQGTPVIYFSNDRLFCRKHKAEACARAAVGFTAWKSKDRADRYESIGGTLYTPMAGTGSSKLISKFGKGRRGK